MLVITKKLTPLVRFAWLFYNQTVFQKFERTFFDQVAIDAKSVLTFEKCHFVTFSISALPPEGTFQMSTHF